MKKYIYTLVFGSILMACTKSNDKGIVISVLEDTTETDFIARPHPDAIMPIFGFDNGLWHSVRFRYGSITSFSHNGRQEHFLDGATALLGNEIERKKEVSLFKQSVRATLEGPKDYSKGRFSSIWKPLVEELEALQKEREVPSVLYVFSDLRENNREWFSLYRYEDMMRLENEPEGVKKLFLEHAMAIERYDPNIRVVVVYSPSTLEEDASFSLLSQLYTSIFKELGIPISFVANLDATGHGQ